jgi:hypothetical protein
LASPAARASLTASGVELRSMARPLSLRTRGRAEPWAAADRGGM